MTILIPILIVSTIGLIAGVGLTIASSVMAVSVDETAANINSVLPGANCGACGYAGCSDYASAIAGNRDVKPNLCTVGGQTVARKISVVLGVDFEGAEEKYARVHCAGTYSKTRYVMDYRGLQSCSANKTFYRGRGACAKACLGFGDCADACEYGAIFMYHGIAVIDKDRCVGCGQCVKKCPNGLIDIASKSATVFVRCSNHDRGAVTKSNCKVGCIGCGKCVKACPFDAIAVNDYLAVIDPGVCRNCGLCVKECPTGIIRSITKGKFPQHTIPSG
jgi:Na+-translocating ferredoxin:NAD+ oxidoreductase RNF subunit RnfB